LQLLVAKYLYDPFGFLIDRSGPVAEANLYRWSSKEYHVASGLSYYGFRYYDAGLQRWINADPIQEFGGINLFRFVGNSPIDVVDPNGLWFKETFRKIGHWIYDKMMGNTGPANPNGNLNMLSQELGGMDSGVLRRAMGEGTGMIGDVGTDAASGKVLKQIGGKLLDEAGDLMKKCKAPANAAGKGAEATSKLPKRVTNKKHHPNSKSPEPKNVNELFNKSVADPKTGARWAKDADGTIHRFSPPSNGSTHWNGSTAGRGIHQNQLPSREILNQLR